MSVLVVGSVAIDSVKTPFGERERSLGGAATHFSVSASYFTDVSVVGVVGADFTDEDMAVFRERNINTENLQQIPDGKTFRWVGEYGFDLNTARTLDTQLNVFGDFKPQLTESAKKSPYLFLANILPSLQREVREQVDCKFVAMDTMNFWISNAKEELLKTLAVVDAVIINDAEARELAGESNLVKAARKIIGLGPKFLVVKRGEYGAALFTRDSYFATVAFPLESVFDPTGAGDSFAGGFMGYLAKTQDIGFENMKTAIIVGSAMASFCVEKFGPTRLKEVTRPEIERRIQQFKNLVSFDIELV
mgnify:CR=1 FL=1